MNGYTLLTENKRYKYYVSTDGKLARATKNSFIELGYIEDNLALYKRLCEVV